MAATVEEPRKQRTARVDWAGLLRRAFALDVFVCLRCGGRCQVLAYLMAPNGMRAILEHFYAPTVISAVHKVEKQRGEARAERVGGEADWGVARSGAHPRHMVVCLEGGVEGHVFDRRPLLLALLSDRSAVSSGACPACHC